MSRSCCPYFSGSKGGLLSLLPMSRLAHLPLVSVRLVLSACVKKQFSIQTFQAKDDKIDRQLKAEIA
ncbi:hypothetical protein GBL50_07670 [Streptococcus equi]|nr:hypothetical protein [Streptococcus equi]NBK57949.1 hypothetical protein [Streptococcus equi]NBK59887.1 hypothetical protein [Streptococcus equi]NBK67005.1 hypothetical protein [Streptococcus equi]NBK68824.1 hypothetical protein [Streptococcus equi]